MIEEKSENNLYELTFLLAQENSAKAREIIEKNGGKVNQEKTFAKIHLTYPILKQSYAFMGGFQFEILPSAVDKLTKNLHLDGGLIRFMISRAKSSNGVSARPTRSFVPRSASTQRLVRKPAPESSLTNEAIEKKIEEILK